MKKLFTLFALLAVFLGAKADVLVDAEVDFSQYTDISQVPRFSWGGAQQAWDRLSIQDGCLHWSSTEVPLNDEGVPTGWLAQWFPIGGVDAEVGVTYTLHYKVKGDHAENISAIGFGLENYGEFPITTEWVEGTYDYVCTKAEGNILMQAGSYIGEFDIAYLKITHEGKAPRPTEWVELLTNGDAETPWEDLGLADVAYNDMDNNYKICFWSKEKGHNLNADGGWDPFPAEIVQEADGNHAFICRAQLADTEGDPSAWDNQIWIESPRAWKTGEQFRLKFRYKASVNVTTNTQYHKQTPSDYLHWQAVGDVNFTTEWQDFEQIVTIPADANGAWSIAFNLNPNNKEPMDFYIDDISWAEMKLEHGLYVTAANPKSGLVDYDFDEAQEFVYDDDMSAMATTVGTAGNQDSWVSEVMISTVRGNDRQYKANTLKTKGAIKPYDRDADKNWVNYEEGASAKIKLPSAGVWNIFVDTDGHVMAFEFVEGDQPEEPEEIVANPSEIVIETVEREMSLAEAEAAGLIESAANATEEEKALYPGQPWDNQFFLIGNRALEVGEEVFVSFDYMAGAPATVGTQNSKDAGGYLHWAGLGNVEFTTDWQHFEATVTVPSETSGNQNSWTFNLSNAPEANVFYIKNIIFCNGDKTKSLIDMKTENPANFQKKIGAGTGPVPTGIINVVNKTVNNGVMYNLAGQRVAKDYKGVVIMNGQKFVVK